MQNIGYTNRNAFKGYGTLTIFLYLYFIKMFIAILMAIILQCNKNLDNNNRFKQIFWFMRKNLFFNHILGFSLEAYFEFYLIGHMNYQTINFSTNGEILGALETVFALFMMLVFLKILSIFIPFISGLLLF